MTELRPLLFALPGNEDMATALASHMDAELGEIETRRFLDEETYLRLLTNPAGRSIALVCTLDRRDLKFRPIVFAASAAQQLGAIRVGLVAPYLSYCKAFGAIAQGAQTRARRVLERRPAFGREWPHALAWEEIDHGI